MLSSFRHDFSLYLLNKTGACEHSMSVKIVFNLFNYTVTTLKSTNDMKYEHVN